MAIDVLSVEHTGITVSDLARSLALWRDVLGFEVTRPVERPAPSDPRDLLPVPASLPA